MKRIMFTICLGLFVLSINAQTKGIQFRDDVDVAFKQAEKEDKLVFMYFYVPDCNACDWLEKEFSNTSLGELYKNSFLSYKVDASAPTSGQKTAQYFGVFSFPTMLYIHPSGEVRFSARGYRDGKAIFEAGKLGRKSKRDIKKLMENRYKDDPTNAAHLYDYIEYQFVKQNYSKANKLLKEYFDQRSKIEENAWMNLVLDYASDHESPAHALLLEERDLFTQKYGKKLINEIIWNSVIRKIELTTNPNNISKFYSKFITEFKKMNFTVDDDLTVFYSKFILNNPLLSQLKLSSKDEAVLTKFALESILIKEHKFDREHLLSIAVHLLKFHQKDTAMVQLNDALAYNQSIAPHYSYLDAQSLALYALGQEDAAIQKITQARELALSKGIRYYKPSVTEFRKLGILK